MSPQPRCPARRRAPGLPAALLLLLTCACAPLISAKARSQARIGYDLGVESLNRQDYREALRVLMAAVQQDPGLAQAHNALGLVLHVLHQDAAAQSHYAQALALKPDFSEARNNLGILLLDGGHYAAAIASFEAALANLLYPTPHLAEGNMGWAYYKLGQPEAARRHLETALRLEPRFCRGYQWLARMAWEQAGAAEVPPAEAPLAEALVRHSQRFVRHCVEDGQVAKTVAPGYRQEMQYYLGLGLLAQGKTERALAAFARCTEGLDAAALRAAPDESGEAGADFARRCARSAGAARRSPDR